MDVGRWCRRTAVQQPLTCARVLSGEWRGTSVAGMVGPRAHHPAGGRLRQNISEGLTHAVSHLALVGTCDGVLVGAASACAGLCAAGHTRLAPVRIVEIDTATHSGVSYVVRPARYTTAGTVMVDAPPREYEVTFDGMGFVR